MRLADQEEVFAAPIASWQLATSSASYRNTLFAEMKQIDSVQSIHFVYPSDSAFHLQKQDSTWFLKTKKVEATPSEGISGEQVKAYLDLLTYKTSDRFEDQLKPSGPSLMHVQIIAASTEDLVIRAYPIVDGYLLESSQRPGIYFKDDDLLKVIFVSESHFF